MILGTTEMFGDMAGWWIIPVSKHLVTPIYKPWSSPIWKGNTPILRGLKLTHHGYILTTYVCHGSRSSKWRGPTKSFEATSPWLNVSPTVTRCLVESAGTGRLGLVVDF